MINTPSDWPDDHIKQLAWLGVPRAGKLAERIAREILDDTIVRRLQRGALLARESAMMQRYGIGRASLREALRILEIYGFIKMKPGPLGGPVVTEVTGSDFGRSTAIYFRAVGATFDDLLIARLAIEPMMAQVAAENRTADGLAQLHRSVRDHDRLARRPGKGWGHASTEFHAIVNGLSGNRVLDLVGRSLLEMNACRNQGGFPMDSRGEVQLAHERIAAAIVDGDGPAAARRMRHHLEVQLAYFLTARPQMLTELIRWS